MSKSFKVTTILITCILVIVSTMFGVLAAKRISQIPLGDNVTMASLDKTDAEVGMINFLLIGVDKDGTRSDTIMLFCYDGYSNRVNILSFPRDTIVETGGWKQKLNGAIGVGIQKVKSGKDQEPEEELIRLIKRMSGLPIHYSLTVNFDGFQEIIDALGGVDFDVPYNMNYDDPAQDLHIHLKKGPQHLDGKAAHDFVRFRHNNDGSAPGEYVMGDEGRIYWQQEFMKELYRQKVNAQLFANLNEIFEIIAKNVKTNYTMQDLMKHVGILQKIDINAMGSYKLPGGSQYINGVWWYVQDEKETMELIQEVFLPRSTEEWEKQQAEKAEKEPVSEE
ncbi:MAG: LCP family protein [Bacteroidales bacterium]|nr:LCP family protein [Bacteroidales bacterium]